MIEHFTRRDTNTIFEEWKLNGELHNVDDKPSRICRYNNAVHFEEWHQHGNLFRIGAPAHISYFPNSGKILCQKWFPFITDGPTKLEYFHNGNIKSETWVIEEQLRTREYNSNGEIIKEIWFDFEYVQHRRQSASYIQFKNNKPLIERWKQFGKLHRLDGPALIDYSFDGATVVTSKWFINGKSYRVKDIKQILNFSQKKKLNYPLTTSQQLLLKLKFG